MKKLRNIKKSGKKEIDILRDSHYKLKTGSSQIWTGGSGGWYSSYPSVKQIQPLSPSISFSIYAGTQRTFTNPS